MAGQGGNVWSGQTADGHARQHNGMVFNTTNYNYGPPGGYGDGGPSQQRQQRPPQQSPPRAASGLRRLRKEDYTVGWICALAVPELRASRFLLDEEHEDLRIPTRIQYVYGSMNGHNIVMGCLPATQPGKGAAASVVSEMITHFPWLRFGLLVGVAGGVPGKRGKIRLGDVVVSQPDRNRRHGGLIQYDYGKLIQDEKFVQNGVLNPPSEILLSGLSKVQSILPGRGSFQQYVGLYQGKHYPEFNGGISLVDRLFAADHKHVKKDHSGGGNDDEEGDDNEEDDPCEPCLKKYGALIERGENAEPTVHYGSIASGDKVVRDAKLRDTMGRQQGVLAFEMEAAGVINVFPCLVIRGICDYCDTHKNKDWQPFAAAAAAAWAKEFLRNVASAEVAEGNTIGQVAQEQPLKQAYFPAPWPSNPAPSTTSPNDFWNPAAHQPNLPQSEFEVQDKAYYMDKGRLVPVVVCGKRWTRNNATEYYVWSDEPGWRNCWVHKLIGWPYGEISRQS